MQGPVLPAPIIEWCTRTLGSPPLEQVFTSSQMASVVGVRLRDGRTVVVKARGDDPQRAARCVTVQRVLADGGFPCPRPLTDVALVAGQAVHAEEWRPGGHMLRGEAPHAAERFAELLAQLVARAAAVDVAPPLPNPIWVRWDHDEPGPWPAYDWHDARVGAGNVPEHVEDTARRVRARLRQVTLQRVIGHADWETQNLRWHGDQPYAVHDWDSLAWLPEAALAGAASGAFASAEQPTLAPLEASAVFLDTYENARGRPWTVDERQVAWAASLWLPAHNARAEALYGRPAVATKALADQAAARLALAHA